MHCPDNEEYVSQRVNVYVSVVLTSTALSSLNQFKVGFSQFAISLLGSWGQRGSALNKAKAIKIGNPLSLSFSLTSDTGDTLTLLISC